MHPKILFSAIALVFSSSLLRAAEPAPLPVAIAAHDAHLRYVGRWDGSSGPQCSWSGCSVQFVCTATAIEVELEGNGPQIQIVIDGKPTSVLKVTQGKTLYPVASSLDAQPHTVELFKRTEPFVGSLKVVGFHLAEHGHLNDLPPAPKHRIEFVGDSITCGYGVDAPDQTYPFQPDTENNYLAYGAVSARALYADYHCEAWTGAWMMDRAGAVVVPKIFPRTLPLDEHSVWNFSQWIPHVVVVNLGTNDFGPGTPDEAGWTSQYVAFAQVIHRVYPKAQLYLAVGPMFNGEQRISALRYVKEIVETLHAAGFKKISVLDLGTQDIGKNGVGANYHPSVKTHQEMADQVVSTVRTDLGWQ